MSPDGRYIVVTNDSQRTDLVAPASASNLVSGYSLTVVDARTMRVTDVFHGDGVDFFTGITAMRDPANRSRTIILASDGGHNSLRIFDLGGDGKLTPEPQAIALPTASDTGYANDGHAFPATIGISQNGRIAYVANNLGESVSAVDVGARSVLHSTSVGYYPYGVAVAGNRLFATNSGFAQYRVLSQPARAPQFTNPAADQYKSSSLSIVSLQGGGDVNTTDPPGVVRMDPVPNGVDDVGSARPSSIVVRGDGRYAYVSLANVDRIATVSLFGAPHVVGGLDLRLFVNAPYGTAPSAEALSKDGKMLYVALAGINAVAVLDARDPSKLHRLGLIPTGWYPSALTLSPDGHYLYVADAKGVDGWGLLQRVDLRRLSLVHATLAALHYNRAAQPAKEDFVVPPLRSNKRSNTVDRIVYISVGSNTYDAMLGDLKGTDGQPHGSGEPSLTSYPQSVTPNLHALARTYALADNFYANDWNIDANQQFGLSGVTTLYTARTADVNDGRAPLDAHAQDPENYPRAGYLFNSLARADLSFRDYGGLMRLSGYTEATPAPAPTPSRGRGRETPRPPAQVDPGGGNYGLDVPALAALAGHVDLNYPGWNTSVTDVQRAQAFIDDMEPLARNGQEPSYTYVWLPTVAGAAGAADADRALGKIVEFLSQTPHWSSTAIFIVPDGIQSGRDHVNPMRSYALVVSPLAKRGYVGNAHLSVASVVKTEEELLGLSPLALNDLLATDMADFFSDVPYPSQYQALP